MSRVLVISDLHFGHKNICKYRPEFSSMHEHDMTLLDNVLSSVNKRDCLWLLGDCFFQKHTIEYALKISANVETLNFIPGNHDTDNSERLGILKQLISYNTFNKVGSMFKTKHFWLSHPPIHPAELRGRPNVHGHVHTATVPDKNYMNVSAENVFYKPVNMQDLLACPERVLRDFG